MAPKSAKPAVPIRRWVILRKTETTNSRPKMQYFFNFFDKTVDIYMFNIFMSRFSELLLLTQTQVLKHFN